MQYHLLIWLAAAIAVPAVSIVLFVSLLQYLGNFHEVIAGEYYRSAQPTPQRLAGYVQKYGIRTVLNLRGKDLKHDWYAEEVAESARLGVQLVDFKMSAKRQLTDAQTQQLVSLLRDLPKPILVHCKQGADRSGLVSAIYLYKIAGRSEADAEAQISLRYGHIGIPYFSDAFAMDRNWQRLEKTLSPSS